MNPISNINEQELGELLKSYYQGGLSEIDKASLEELSSTDEFLADAMEGLNQFPTAIENIPAFTPKANSFSWLAVGGILALSAIGAYFIFSSQIETPAENTVNSSEMAEVKTPEETPSNLNSTLIIETKEKNEVSNPIKTEPQTNNKAENNTVETAPAREIFEIPKMELNPIEIEQKKEYTIKKAKTKSIYFHGFLAVDYSLIYNNSIEISQQLSGTDASRSHSSNETSIPDNGVSTKQYSYKGFLKQSCLFMKERKFSLAVENFQAILTQFPNDVNAIFYLGYSYFETRNFNKAISFFDKAMNHSFHFFYEDAEWFKANSLENLGKLKEAQKIYNSIKRRGGFYSDRLD